jgi:hypothetical protein
MNDSWREYLHFPLLGYKFLMTENKMVTKTGFYLGNVGVRNGTCNIINFVIPVLLYVFDQRSTVTLLSRVNIRVFIG